MDRAVHLKACKKKKRKIVIASRGLWEVERYGTTSAYCCVSFVLNGLRLLAVGERHLYLRLTAVPYTIQLSDYLCR